MDGLLGRAGRADGLLDRRALFFSLRRRMSGGFRTPLYLSFPLKQGSVLKPMGAAGGTLLLPVVGRKLENRGRRFRMPELGSGRWRGGTGRRRRSGAGKAVPETAREGGARRETPEDGGPRRFPQVPSLFSLLPLFGPPPSRRMVSGRPEASKEGRGVERARRPPHPPFEWAVAATRMGRGNGQPFRADWLGLRRARAPRFPRSRFSGHLARGRFGALSLSLSTHPPPSPRVG